MQELLKEMHAWMDAYMKSFHTDDEEVMQESASRKSIRGT